MATSTLIVTQTSLKQSVGYALGYGRSSWDATQTANIAEAIEIGLRRVYGAHDWSFLHFPATITVWGTITGTISSIGGTGNKTVTASASVFYPTCVGQRLVADTSENSYLITGYTSGTVITVASDASADDGDTFTITATGDYIMPDDFGSIDTRQFIHATGTGYCDIPLIGHAEILSRRAKISSNGVPLYAAIRSGVSTDGTSNNSLDQRFWACFDPLPGDTFVLNYRYRKLPDLLVDSTNEYPYGGQSFSELIRVACLAAAEEEIDGTPGIHSARYPQLLAEAIQKDGMMGPHSLGVPRGDIGEDRCESVRYGMVNYVGML